MPDVTSLRSRRAETLPGLSGNRPGATTTPLTPQASAAIPAGGIQAGLAGGC